MNINLRKETEADYHAVFRLITQAFEGLEFTDHREQYLVQRLRNSSAFIPDLALVAEHENEIVGHILLTKISIKHEGQDFGSLALAPVSVLPDFQHKGIGGMLIRAAHQEATALGHESVILLGHNEYYPRFGYTKASTFGIRLPFDVPDEYCMAIELIPGALKDVQGMVEYPREFFE